MAELNFYISDVMKREMNYFSGIDWEKTIHEALWKKLSTAKKNHKQKQTTL